MRRASESYGRIDWATVMLYLALVLIGWVNIYAAVYDEAHSSILDIGQRYGKQMIWILAAAILAFVILLIDAKVFNAFTWFIYGFIMLMLAAVLVIGTEISGSRSWFQIGSIAIQPAEFGKFATCLALARYLSAYSTDFSSFRAKFISLVIIFFPAMLVLLQNDTGSAVVYAALLLVLYREGLSGTLLLLGIFVLLLFILTILFNQYFVAGGLVIITGLLLFFSKKIRKKWLTTGLILILSVGFAFSVEYAFNSFLEPHQRTRINVLLGKQIDLQGAGYNVHQSKIAIGSGGFAGKGFLKGTQTKYNFVPEQSTDFIFCTIGEEWGFLGSSVVIILYVLLLYRLIRLAERQRSDFSRVYGYGVVSILFFHFTVNIGMTLGLVPVIGIPLPFISYGGSSLWAFTILLFIFIKLDANRLRLL
jgi:rod shape determining protein RodA